MFLCLIPFCFLDVEMTSQTQQLSFTAGRHMLSNLFNRFSKNRSAAPVPPPVYGIGGPGNAGGSGAGDGNDSDDEEMMDPYL